MSAPSIAASPSPSISTKTTKAAIWCFRNSAAESYRAPDGGAVVFSCGALHQVTPITRGRRYAFLAFLYGEADAALREANNSRLNESAAQYVVESDRLFPDREVNAARQAS